MDIFGIKRRAEKKKDEMRKIYLERKKHYEDVWYDAWHDIEGCSSEDVREFMRSIGYNVKDLRERVYDRHYDSLDEIVEDFSGSFRFEKILKHACEISIEIIERIIGGGCYSDFKEIGEYIYEGNTDPYFFRITDKDVLYVLERLGFRKYFLS